MKHRIKFLTINPGSIELTKSHVIEYIGYKTGQCPGPVRDLVKEVLAGYRSYLKIKTARVECSRPGILPAEGKIILKDHEFHCSKIIASDLRESEKLIIFLSTIGPGLEEWSKEQTKAGDALKGYLIDTVGSIAADSVVDVMREKIAVTTAQEGFSLTNSYSPGYCQWDVSEQQKLFSYFPGGCCGITLSDSCLMTPIKSVSGIIGAGSRVKRREYRCGICTMKSCHIKKNRS